MKSEFFTFHDNGHRMKTNAFTEQVGCFSCYCLVKLLQRFMQKIKQHFFLRRQGAAASAGLNPKVKDDMFFRQVFIQPFPLVDILRSQGLSAQELRLLATYSAEEHFPPNAMIFAEGESGDALHIVVDGAVRISRMVPGMGEECLAILGRGEVFGEMALIDGQPRSADARAHRPGCTVFSISRSLLEEVLSMDPDAAVQFLGLLCRLLCRRIRAMNERLVAWRVMASHE